ncbi:MAG: SDR family oxidoreductase [Candidatus Protistobacter heckmanni]|nr:SDR family oxidoreductase [Candidatus Protistobacter heckmanni]
MRPQNKKAVVTAAGQGIGKASALTMAREGATVWATDVNPELLAAYKGVPNIQTAELNVLNTAEVNAFAAKTGTVDILFNCAGYVHHGTILECGEDDWDFSMDLNCKAMFRTIRAFLPGILAQRKGSIINMSSAASSIKGAPNRLAYSASKAAVLGLTRAMAADTIAQGVRCNAICPGTIQSPSLDGRIEAAAKRNNSSLEQARAGFVERQPMGRLGTAEEIAALVIYLASDESSFTTGTAQLIDGGWTL